ncbi:ABC transporter ATP-binding protein [Bacillus haikouensis]|nr:ABC transporter ATP-binding protein [Bacillus haikouensis]
MIELKNIEKDYLTGKERVKVLHDINLSIERGELTAIMGPSGSGKSTLMNIIGCLDRPAGGKYYLNGEDIADYSENDLSHLRNQSIGFVFQQFMLLPRLTAFKNIELPMVYAGTGKKERESKVWESLEKVGLKDKYNHFPNELSGGQKQRVAIARALVNNPDLVLADEPTGALDTKTGSDIMSLFKELNSEGATIVIITHENEVARQCNRVINIRDGKITT